MLWTIKYNMSKLHKRFKPGDIVYLEGLPSVQYLILETDYHITKLSRVHVYKLSRENTKTWYPDVWFSMMRPGKLSKIETLIYNV